MLRKNFPGRKALRRNAALARQQNPLDKEQRLQVQQEAYKRSQAFETWRQAMQRACYKVPK